MNKEKLKQYIREIYPVPEDKLSILADDFEYFSFEKNQYLLKEHVINKYSFFLEKGYVRSFVFDMDGQEVTTNIYSAPCVVNDFLSFFKKEPATENFQTITEGYGWKRTYDTIEQKFQNSPEFREFGRLLVLHDYHILRKRMLEMIQDSAENRYRKLLSEHPDIFQHVPLKIIASYLGITDTSLSRIRKEIVQK